MARKKKKKLLTETDILKFDLNNESNKRRKNEIEILNLKRKLLEQQKIIMDKDIRLLDNNLLLLKNIHINEKAEHKLFYKNLCDELGVKAGFGFNADTGEVVE